MRIKEFARTIGLSPTTVSQAVSGTGRVSPQTRALVLRRMRELGYVPNPHAQQLVTGRSRIVVLHHTDQDIFTDLYLIELAHQIQHALRARGCGLLLDTANELQDEDNPLRAWLESAAVDGVMLVRGWSEVHGWMRRFASARTPVVLFGEADYPDLPHVGNVRFDSSRALRQAVELLAAHGHRRIGYLGLRAPDTTEELLRRCLAEHGLSLPSPLAICAGFTMADGVAAARHLLSLPDPPTAVVCRKDDLAIGALNAAAQMGVRVPKELAVIGHDDVPMAAITDPPLTTLRIHCDRLGAEAVDLLFTLLENPDARPGPRTVEAELVVRDSVAGTPSRRRRPAPALRG